MDLNKLTEKAKQMFDKRGGTQAAKEDATELEDIARKNESVTDKVKDAAAAIEDPGAPGPNA
jgi:hypothetical protein